MLGRRLEEAILVHLVAHLRMLGAEIKWPNGFSLATTFEGEFAGNVTGYAGKGVAKYSW